MVLQESGQTLSNRWLVVHNQYSNGHTLRQNTLLSSAHPVSPFPSLADTGEELLPPLPLSERLGAGSVDSRDGLDSPHQQKPRMLDLNIVAYVAFSI
jgi:hypothetical protein